MTSWILLGAFTAFVAGMAVASITAWLVAERDERRWRRKLREQQAAMLVRQHRYGTTGGSRKHG